MVMIIKVEVKSISEANDLYSKYDVVLEECILESDEMYYSICKINRLDIYDVLLIDKSYNKLINFESRTKLSNSTLKYFYHYKGEVYNDWLGNNFKCISHYVCYKD